MVFSDDVTAKLRQRELSIQIGARMADAIGHKMAAMEAAGEELPDFWDLKTGEPCSDLKKVYCRSEDESLEAFEERMREIGGTAYDPQVHQLWFGEDDVEPLSVSSFVHPIDGSIPVYA